MIKTSFRRPVAVAMAYIAVALLGLRAWQDIPIERFPDTSLPRLNISTSWRGASPETMEAFLTSPVEAAVQLVEGVEQVTSRSIEGSATITALFQRDTDMDFARLTLIVVPVVYAVVEDVRRMWRRRRFASAAARSAVAPQPFESP